ncbi:MAG: aspartate/tyrosine/aromatic aminotransferase [Proteobacteria bacterium]|nr:aspartate/tyrosine/aromatic aminotransferase [Pseudomonadota bacterium]
MFETLKEQPADALLALIAQFRNDPRKDKIDLGVGVYRDTTGATPILKSVKAAEKILLETQDSKSYLGSEGDAEFTALCAEIVFGTRDNPRITGIQTPGGTGALRLAAEIISASKPGARVLLGLPSWPNHAPIMAAAGLQVVTYPYFDLAGQKIRFEEMLAALDKAEAGDVVLLHACCHNPTGADLSAEQWKAVTKVILERKLFPLIDCAYQGLGHGLDEDAKGLRDLIAVAEEALVAYSCNKNFGLYRDRVGALFVLGRNADAAKTVFSNLMNFARVCWSMPPDHGAAIVRTILSTPELRRQWNEEVVEMRTRLRAVREAVARADQGFGFVPEQNGMFTNFDLPPAAIQKLRAEHGIYMAGSGRINIAGLQVEDAARFVAALKTVRG